ncbi:hypothetical protein ACFYT4_19215 [Streptomyces sp. NPDC004609]
MGTSLHAPSGAASGASGPATRPPAPATRALRPAQAIDGVVDARA